MSEATPPDPALALATLSFGPDGRPDAAFWRELLDVLQCTDVEAHCLLQEARHRVLVGDTLGAKGAAYLLGAARRWGTGRWSRALAEIPSMPPFVIAERPSTELANEGVTPAERCALADEHRHRRLSDADDVRLLLAMRRWLAVRSALPPA